MLAVASCTIKMNKRFRVRSSQSIDSLSTFSYGVSRLVRKSANVGSAGAENCVKSRKSSKEAIMSDSVKMTDRFGAW